MKPALLAASLVLVGGTAVACGGGGGGDGAPTDASKKDFCDAYSSLFTDMAALGGAEGEAPAEDAMLKSIKEWAKKMEDVGTPEGISDDARKGFALTMNEIDDLNADDLKDTSLEDLNGDLSEDEKKQAEEFTTYLTDECGNPLEELAPSDAPS